MVNIVFILILMTVGIVALRVGNYLPENTDILFVVGKNPSFEIEDSNKKSWESGTEVNIFSSEYKNGDNVTSVVSQDGTAVIAPGTRSVYKFGMYNNGNMAVVYETDIDFDLSIGGEGQGDYTFPLVVRLKTESGEYLLGGDNEWVNVNDAKLKRHVSTLGARSYEGFVLELLWEFEGGNDELDTMYGNASSEKGVNLTLGIGTYAEEHINPEAKGGTPIQLDGDNSNSEYGGTFRWGWLLILIINAAILLFYVAWLLNKRLQKW